MPFSCQGVGKEMESRSGGCTSPRAIALCLWSLDLFLTHSIPSISNSSYSPEFLIQLMHLNLLLGKCLPQILDLILFLRDPSKNEVRGTLESKVIRTVHWAGREQRGGNPVGNQWKALGRRWPASVVSWQTWCSCPHWWQRVLWWPQRAEAW